MFFVHVLSSCVIELIEVRVIVGSALHLRGQLNQLQTLFINGGHIYNSFVHVQISLPSLILEQEFFSSHCMVSRLGRLICTLTKEL